MYIVAHKIVAWIRHQVLSPTHPHLIPQADFHVKFSQAANTDCASGEENSVSGCNFSFIVTVLTAEEQSCCFDVHVGNFYSEYSKQNTSYIKSSPLLLAFLGLLDLISVMPIETWWHVKHHQDLYFIITWIQIISQPKLLDWDPHRNKVQKQ